MLSFSTTRTRPFGSRSRSGKQSNSTGTLSTLNSSVPAPGRTISRLVLSATRDGAGREPQRFPTRFDPEVERTDRALLRVVETQDRRVEVAVRDAVNQEHFPVRLGDGSERTESTACRVIVDCSGVHHRAPIELVDVMGLQDEDVAIRKDVRLHGRENGLPMKVIAGHFGRAPATVEAPGARCSLPSDDEHGTVGKRRR
jgi:hypothetical protein